MAWYWIVILVIYWLVSGYFISKYYFEFDTFEYAAEYLLAAILFLIAPAGLIVVIIFSPLILLGWGLCKLMERI